MISIQHREGRTDVAFARRLLDASGNDLLFIPEWDRWVVWDQKRWKLDVGGWRINQLALKVSDRLWEEAEEADGKEAFSYAHEMAKPVKWNAALPAAEAFRPLSSSRFDADPWLLNCVNGTVDLRTGHLHPHRREDYQTKLCPTPYEPDASMKTWLQFLNALFNGQQHLIDFLARLMGYSLTGKVSEQILAIFWGTGSNGKSTLLNAILESVGGDYTMTGRSEMLIVRHRESHPTAEADLFGSRIVAFAETNDGRRLNEGLIKQLTGGEPLRARRMREDFWQFNPMHKGFLCTNHKPEVRGQDHGIWRRLVLIPFLQTFWNPDKDESGPGLLKQDKSLPAKLRAKASGILAWMARGCLEWQREGLKIPKEVCAATNQYRADEDLFSQFIFECCLTGSDVCKASAAALRNAFLKWSGQLDLSAKAFGMEMAKRGFVKFTSDGTWYRGIALRPRDRLESSEGCISGPARSTVKAPHRTRQ